MGITTLSYRGFDAVKLTFNRYSATIINGRGCNIIEFTDTINNLSFLHTPTEEEHNEFMLSPQRFGNAILFHPNKILEGRFVKNNTEYDFSEYGIPWSHGIIKELPFEFIESEENGQFSYIKFRFNSKTTPYYTGAGWNFTLDFEFTLSADGLTQNIIFHNAGKKPIPFGLGFHTAFKIPFGVGDPDRYRAFVSCDNGFETSDGYPTGRTTALCEPYTTTGVVPLDHPIAEHTCASVADFSTIDEDLKNFHGAIICDTKTNARIIFETDPKFTHWMIWNNKASSNYLCIEPMTWMINAPNIELPDSITGFRFIASSETWEAKNRLYVRL